MATRKTTASSMSPAARADALNRDAAQAAHAFVAKTRGSASTPKASDAGSYVCPVTGTKFSLSNPQAIIDHQSKLLTGQKEVLTAQRVALAKKEMGALSTASSVRAAVTVLQRALQLLVGPDKEVPAIKAIEVPQKGARAKYALMVHFDALDKDQAALFTQLPELTKTKSAGNANALAWDVSATPLKPLIQNHWFGKTPKKLTDAQKAALVHVNPVYRDKMESLAHIASHIHSLRQQANVLTQECETIRNNTAAPELAYP